MRGFRNGRVESPGAHGRAGSIAVVVVGLAVGLAAHRWLADGGFASEPDSLTFDGESTSAAALRGVDARGGSLPPPAREPQLRSIPTDVARGGAQVSAGFHLPATGRVGEPFLLRIAVEARQPISRIAFEIRYDPTLLRVRTTEEMDYSNLPAIENPLVFEEMGDGRVVAVLTNGGASVSTAPAMVQIEPLAQGWAAIEVAAVDVRDEGGAPVMRVDGARSLGIALH